ncbi:protein ergS [Aspergillus neoniger CBS 115656]|uniref:Phosphatidylglycerol lysyltransferase C-terminal domain-containing protein n=1 Tax=Aspergillus neoniger (strain CBS 115656) TaxID=1448310 RepID=A0A318YQV4_ASPNB|nr:hypothetical protein BO87DRAFT_434793 [Aspergillus neoniger CBS 115656]PYH35143.1 hypothetical protein BO87DRAFT_434793 [Aspergillus neoniger CBS 115656]
MTSSSTRKQKKPQQANRKVLLADAIGQTLYERLLQARIDCPIAHWAPVHHPLAPQLSSTINCNLSINSTSSSILTTSPSASTSDIKSIPSSRTSHDSLHKPSSSSSSLPPLPSNRIITLGGPCTNLSTLTTITHLAAKYSQVSHMSLLDPSYTVFLNTTHTAAICFKVVHQTAIVAGDPISSEENIPSLLSEFKTYRKSHLLGMAFLGASPRLTHYAQSQSQSQTTNKNNWTMLHFGTSRVLNPTTNTLLNESTGKRLILQNKQLLNPNKGGITLDIYIPGSNPTLEKDLQEIYTIWRTTRNTSSTPQAFITEYTSPFSSTLLPSLMTYIYAKDKNGVPLAFAALRYCGANNGYHIDPCMALPTAPKGLTDLLMFAAMALCRHAGVGYLSVGFEPLEELGEVRGLRGPLEHLARGAYRFAFKRLPSIQGKKAYYDKWRTEEGLEERLFLVLTGAGGGLGVVAVTHVANVRIRRVVWG